MFFCVFPNNIKVNIFRQQQPNNCVKPKRLFCRPNQLHKTMQLEGHRSWKGISGDQTDWYQEIWMQMSKQGFWWYPRETSITIRCQKLHEMWTPDNQSSIVLRLRLNFEEISYWKHEHIENYCRPIRGYWAKYLQLFSGSGTMLLLIASIFFS